jgi:hypothetical protein
VAVASSVKESLVKGAGSKVFGTDATPHIDVAKNVSGYKWFQGHLSKIQALLMTSSPATFYRVEEYVAKRLEKIPADQLNALKEIIDPLPPPLIGLDARAMAVTMRTFRPQGSDAKELSFSLLEQTLVDCNEVVNGFVTRKDLRSLRIALTHGGGSIVSSTQLHAVKWWLNDVVS